MDELVQKSSSPIPKQTTSLSEKEFSSPIKKEDIFLHATIAIEKDITATYLIKVENVNETENGYLVFGSIQDGNVAGSVCHCGMIDFNGRTWTNFNFFCGEAYDKNGRIAKRHAMVQLREETKHQLPRGNTVDAEVVKRESL